MLSCILIALQSNGGGGVKKKITKIQPQTPTENLVIV